MGTVFNIQHFSVHDGPGIRTVVFLKGCPLHCRWCANPESQVCKSELGWEKKQCIGCKECVKIAGMNCRFENGTLLWDADKEIDPKLIKRTCPSEALHVIGEEKTACEVLDEVEKDLEFYLQSGGGLTVSGGEPLLQGKFLLELLSEAKKRGIGRAIETTGFAKYELFSQVCAELDYLLIDVKTMNDEVHKRETKVSNKMILENLKKVRRDYLDLKIKVRTPVVPGVNDTDKDISDLVAFVRSLGPNTEYELLKYHKLGEPKYESLNRSYEMGDVELSEERFRELRKLQETLLYE